MSDPSKKVKHRRRLPNGFGGITKINGRNLRKPYRAMICVGKNEYGRPICKLLQPKAYFETYNEAYAALLAYHQNPYDSEKDITMQELYERWSSGYFEHLSSSSVYVMKSAWSYCSSVYNMKVRNFHTHQMHVLLDRASLTKQGKIVMASQPIKIRIKSIVSLMMDYAVEYELTDRNYARAFRNPTGPESNESRKEHISFTDEELNTLWKNINTVPYSDLILIQCYSGWRPGEMCELLLENTDLVNWTFTGGIKTKAGRNRTVPIHTKIRPLVQQYYEKSVSSKNKYLFTISSERSASSRISLSYWRYSTLFASVINTLELNPNHRPHDPRKQFVTMAKKSGVDEYAIKRMVGHTITDLTERVYTDRSIDWLRKEIEKI